MKQRIPELSFTKKDFKVSTFKSGGKGGQHQNKTDSGVRITHIDSGISAECRETRSQKRNKEIAFRRLAKILIAHYSPDTQKERYAAGHKTVRTYNMPDNRIKDHDSKRTYSYSQIEDPSKMIEERNIDMNINKKTN